MTTAPPQVADKFEWTSVHAGRFGIVHVDDATHRRRPKDSALWNRSVVQQEKAARVAAESGT